MSRIDFRPVSVLILAALVFLGQLAGHREHLAAGLLERLHVALGWGAYGVPLSLAALGGALLAWGLGARFAVPWPRLGGGGVVLGVALGLTERWRALPATREGLARGGGAAGNWLDGALTGALGGAGATIVLVAVGLVGVSLALGISLAEILAAAGRLAALVREAWEGLRARRPAPAPATGPLPLFETAPPAPPKHPRPAAAPAAPAEEPAPAPPPAASAPSAPAAQAKATTWSWRYVCSARGTAG